MSRDAFAENFVECNVAVDPDGRAAYNGKTLGETSACAHHRDAQVVHQAWRVRWTNLTQKAM